MTSRTSSSPSSPDGSPTDERLEELRKLILGHHARRLKDLADHVSDSEVRAVEVGEVLPRAVRLSQEEGSESLQDALAPSVVAALRTSLKTNQADWAQTLFPIIGPSIRKAISATLNNMLETLNQTLDRSLSPRSLRWRLEAWRTEKPFSEVVLLNTLEFRVEQVFLIGPENGLLMVHLVGEEIAAQDPELISGMLTAIRDFVQDSFRVASSAGLSRLRVGELSVWIEQGAYGVVAAVIRGEPPAPYREHLQVAVEMIHRENGPLLEQFNGDTAGFEVLRPKLEPLLMTQFREKEKGRLSPLLWAIPILLVLGLGLLLFFSYRSQARWSALVEQFRNEPGIVLIRAEREGGAYYLQGLRDPLAGDPSGLIAASPLSAQDFRTDFRDYYSSDPRFVRLRAARLLRPPRSVTLALTDRVLRVTGHAPREWRDQARGLGGLIPGIDRIDDSKLVISSTVVEKIESAEVAFVHGTLRLETGQEAALEALKAEFNALGAKASEAGERVRVVVHGYHSAPGPAGLNDRLAVGRAEAGAELLSGFGLDPELFTIEASPVPLDDPRPSFGFEIRLQSRPRADDQ